MSQTAKSAIKKRKSQTDLMTKQTTLTGYVGFTSKDLFEL